MKSLRNLAIFGLSAVAFTIMTTGCSFSGWGSSNGSPVDLLTPEQRLRNEMQHSWNTCRANTGSEGSTALVINIGSKGITVVAHIYPVAACKGDKYDSYKIAEYVYEGFHTENAHVGSAQIHLKVYYPNDLPVEAGITTFDGNALSEAQTGFFLSVDFQRLHITLDKIKTSDKEVAQKVALDFTRGAGPTDQFTDVRPGGLGVDGIRSANTQADLIQDLRNLKAIDSKCIADYFDNNEPSHFPDARSGLTMYLKKHYGVHLDLVKQGYSVKEYNVMYSETTNKVPSLVFVLRYTRDGSKADSDDTKESNFTCPLKNHAPGVEYRQK